MGERSVLDPKETTNKKGYYVHGMYNVSSEAARSKSSQSVCEMMLCFKTIGKDGMPEDYPLLYALDGVSGSMGWYAENAKAKAKK